MQSEISVNSREKCRIKLQLQLEFAWRFTVVLFSARTDNLDNE